MSNSLRRNESLHTRPPCPSPAPRVHPNLSLWLSHCQSVSQFSHSVMSDSLCPHELQHARPPCPSPAPRVHPNLVMPSNHLTLCRSLSSCPQSFPASRSFQMSQLFASGGQSIGVSASASNEHPGLISFRMGWL